MGFRRLLSLGLPLLALCSVAHAAGPLQVNVGGGDQAGYLRLVALFAAVSLAPALLAVLTSFLRISVVLYFLRAGLGSQQLLPNQVLVGLAILLTVFSMAVPFRELNRVALQPVLAGQMSIAAGATAAEPVARAYLEAHTRPVDLAAMTRWEPQPVKTPDFAALAAAYVLSELRVAFMAGFVVFLPFMVIDLVVAGTIASLGLAGVPQVMLALPFKILLFVMVDGWRLLADSLLAGLR